MVDLFESLICGMVAALVYMSFAGDWFITFIACAAYFMVKVLREEINYLFMVNGLDDGFEEHIKD